MYEYMPLISFIALMHWLKRPALCWIRDMREDTVALFLMECVQSWIISIMSAVSSYKCSLWIQMCSTSLLHYFYDVTLKSSSDNFNISVILALTSIDYIFDSYWYSSFLILGITNDITRSEWVLALLPLGGGENPELFLGLLWYPHSWEGEEPLIIAVG